VFRRIHLDGGPPLAVVLAVMPVAARTALARVRLGIEVEVGVGVRIDLAVRVKLGVAHDARPTPDSKPTLQSQSHTGQVLHQNQNTLARRRY
jgi:hypothetical protein